MLAPVDETGLHAKWHRSFKHGSSRTLLHNDCLFFARKFANLDKRSVQRVTDLWLQREQVARDETDEVSVVAQHTK